jgi:betaine-aldehyde dehydrogenase
VPARAHFLHNGIRVSAIELIEPATGERLASVRKATSDDADRAVHRASAAFPKWRAVNTRDRGRILMRLAQLIRDNAGDLAKLESRNVGKPIRDSRDEVALAANCFEYYAGATNKIGGQTIPGAAPGVLMTFREPVGVCGIIVPWNFPIAIASWKSAPALAMGNTVVLKPAEQTPLTALRLAELALEAGMPEGVFTVLTGPGSVVGEAIITHPLVRKLAFTGSTEIGRRVMELGARDIKRVSLELGGKSANLIFDDCDFDRAVASAVSSSLGNAGQDCCARSRILVQRSIYDRFAQALVTAFEKVIVGDPLAGETEMGPLVTRSHRDRVLSYIDAGRSEGATLATGGHAREGAGTYLEPAVFVDVNPEMKIVREEIFGPVVVAAPFRTLDDIAAEANNSDYGLGAGIWTRDISKAHALAKKLRAGTVWINCYNVFDAALPFGGYKQSGWGREMGHEALHAYTEVKAVTTQL